MNLITHQPDHSTKQVRIMVQGRRAFVPANQIEYLQSDSRYCFLHFTDQRKHLTAHPLKSMSHRVGEGFIRLHSQYLCNSAHIRRVDLRKLTVIMQSGAVLPIATTRIKELVPVLLRWAMGPSLNR